MATNIRQNAAAVGGLDGTCYHSGQAGMESEIKGQSLRHYPVALRALRGDEVADRVLASLSRGLREGLEKGTILTGGWYPVAYKRELHAAGTKVTGEAGLARIMGYEMTKRDLSGIYRTFVRIATPRFVLSLGARIFSTYFRPGTMRVIESRDGFVEVAFTNCAGFDANIWRDVIGGCEATLVVAGAMSVRLRFVSGGEDGDASASATAWWTKDEVVGAKPPV
jgi:hypothetical protein